MYKACAKVIKRFPCADFISPCQYLTFVFCRYFTNALLWKPSTTITVPTTVGGVISAFANSSPTTNVHSVALSPTSITYRGFSYEIPHASAQAPFYCVIEGRCGGVLSTWGDTSPPVMGVSGAIYSCCPSVEPLNMGSAGTWGNVSNLCVVATFTTVSTYDTSCSIIEHEFSSFALYMVERHRNSTYAHLYKHLFKHLFNIPTMARRKVHQSGQDRREAANKYRKTYYQKNKAAILQKMQLKYKTKSKDSTTLSLKCAEDNNLTLQYMGGNLLEESQQPIRDALNISQEAEDAIKASGGDGMECWQVILSLEDVLLHILTQLVLLD
ncbi:hypothetical protein C8R48DRAFT_676099 [Suillus tomentosus]|nr:hypothetical protein C8R48DRAFT_676099 [Suillus tomentosus]